MYCGFLFDKAEAAAIPWEITRYVAEGVPVRPIAILFVVFLVPPLFAMV